MARFIALPVGQGDAFYLETSQGSVLIDGGKSLRKLPFLFKEYTNRDGVDILVVTHNDADHANGVLGFLEAGLECREVWLPGRGAQVLPHVLRPWEEVVLLLAEQSSRAAEEFRKWDREGSLLEQYTKVAASRLDRFRKIKEKEGVSLVKNGWPSDTISQLEQEVEENNELFLV